MNTENELRNREYDIHNLTRYNKLDIIKFKFEIYLF